MNILSLPPSSLIHAIGWTLLHFCWQGALIAVVLTCVMSLLNRQSSQIRYRVACSALLLMTVMPLVTFSYLLMTTPTHTGEVLRASLQIPSGANGSGGSLSTPLLDRIAYTLDRSLPALLFVWGVGVLFVCGRLGLGLVVVHRIKSAAAPTLPDDLRASFQRLACRLSITRPVRLLNSAMVQVPTLIGWFRPVVLIPLGCLSGLSTEQIEAILVHELAHIRRHDYLVSVLQSIVEALLFYHPVVWWVSTMIRREREHCCDDVAVQVGGDALIYARALSLLEEHRSTVPAHMLGATGGNLTMRIKRLLGLEEGPALSQSVAFGILTVMIAALAVSVGTIARAQSVAAGAASTVLVATHSAANSNPASQSPNPNTSAATLSREYQNWLDQDVRWSITPVERRAFLSLASDPERDHFIEQFWLRRDPEGAPPNTFREEHYRRLAYANQHFAASIPGWETDRGRIYILYGPPSGLNAYPAQNSSDESYETWTYKSPPGLGENIELKFVDTCKCGNYQLQQQPASGILGTDQPDEALYDKGLDEIRQGRYETARLALQTLINVYPASSFTRPAQLAIASSWDQQGGPEAAAEASRSYEDARVTPAKIGKDVSAPILTYSVPPDYPESAKQAKVQGSVLVNLWVDEQGATSHVRVLRGISKDLDEKAMQTVRQYRFKPAVQDGKPVLVAVNVEVKFQMF